MNTNRVDAMTDFTQTQTSATPVHRPDPACRQQKDVAADILLAFHFACDVKDLGIAKRLLAALETLAAERHAAPALDQRRLRSAIVAAHERLWELRHN
jgi:hypothetical protein